MHGRYCLLKVTILILSLITYSFAQSTELPPDSIAFQDTCMIQQGVSDNLSCPLSQALQCFLATQLCDGVNDCADGTDEGFNLIALDCTRQAFVCTPGVDVELDQLCDGVDDCGNAHNPPVVSGDDETTVLCENKCLFPFYGSCSYTRECVTTALDVSCGLCRAGFARDPVLTNRDCLSATFAFTQTSFSADESNAFLTGYVRLDTLGQLDQDISIVVSTVGTGTAAVNSDYSAIATTILFPRFSGDGAEIEFQVPLIDNFILEDSETFGLSASATNTGGQAVFSAGGDSATGVIIDDDTLEVGYEQPTYNVVEADTMVEVCLVPTNNVSVDRMVTVATAYIGEATAGLDYDATSTSVTFGPGSVRVCWMVMIRDDLINEGTECFQVNATSQTSDVTLDSASSTAMVCIQDNDVLDFEFLQIMYDVDEGDIFAQVCVDLIAGVLPRIVPVTITTLDGSATNSPPIDFTNRTEVVNFPALTQPLGIGSQQCINILINDDILVETLEFFSVHASSADAGARFPNGDTATVQIADNDIPIFEFDQTTYTVNEGDGQAQATIQLIDRELTFDIQVTVIDVVPGGTATDGDDYTGVAAVLTFSAGDGVGTERSFTFPIDNDNAVEDSETIFLEASAAVPGQFSVGGDQATVVILDNDHTVSAIVGGVLGGVILLIAAGVGIGVGIFFLIRWKRK